MRKIFNIVILMCFLSTIPVIAFAQPTGNLFDTDLIAGGGNIKSAIKVGKVKVWNDAIYLYVKYEVTASGWCISETHLEVTTSLTDIPQRKGNPVPGQFSYESISSGCVTEHTEAIDLNSWTPGTKLFIAAEANVVNLVAGKYATAWGAGIKFPGKNWAMYFNYTVKSPAQDLTVSKTADGTFFREYLWTISKNVDNTLVKIAEGGTSTFQYMVNVEQIGLSDSGWAVNGTITVNNPNSFAVNGVNVTDVVDNGGTCTVTNGVGASIPANSSTTFVYSCIYASAPASYSGTNTATATWDNQAYFTPSGSASGSAPFTITQIGTTNKTVSVNDSLGGNLGTVTGTDSAPFANASFLFFYDFQGVAGTCTSYNNTATINETGQSASKTVTLCVGKDLTVSKTAVGNSSTVSGSINVSNPNDWEAITLTSLIDIVDNGGTCTVDAGPYIVPASGSLNVNYLCSYNSLPVSFSGTNTATATWDNQAYFTPNGAASGSANFIMTPQ